jgi:beta-lactam-binding protein with PASTA domain
MNKKNFIWILPLFTFFASYITMYFFTLPYTIQAPLLVGKTLLEVSLLLSADQCTIKIVGIKDDKDLPEGTIISQFPQPLQSIKSGQTFTCVISKKPPQQHLPSFLGKTSEQVRDACSKLSIRYKLFYIPHITPKDTCIGQFPYPGKRLEQETIIIYLSSEDTKPVILPNFSGHIISDLQGFFDKHDILYHITLSSKIQTPHECQNCKIIGQKPLAGSLVEFKKPFTIQLYVQ